MSIQHHQISRIVQSILMWSQFFHQSLYKATISQYLLFALWWWSFTGDSMCPQVSRTPLSILAVLRNVVVWMLSTCHPTSKSSSPFNIPLVTVTNVPITIGIIIIFMFHNFLNSLARSRYLSFFSHSFSFIQWSAGTAKSTIFQVLFFCWLL